MDRRVMTTLLCIMLAFAAVGTVLYFGSAIFYGGEDFTMSVLATMIGVFWGAASSMFIVILFYFLTSGAREGTRLSNRVDSPPP